VETTRNRKYKRWQVPKILFKGLKRQVPETLRTIQEIRQVPSDVEPNLYNLINPSHGPKDSDLQS